MPKRVHIDPFHPALFVWYAVVLIASAFSVAYAPFVMAFGDFWSGGALVVLDLIFLVSFWVNDHTDFLRSDGVVVPHGSFGFIDSSAGYRASSEFADDLLCAMPLETTRRILMIFGSSSDSNSSVSSSIAVFMLIFILFRALAFNDRLNAIEKRSTIGPRFFRHVKLVAFVLLLIHWLGAAISLVWRHRYINADRVSLVDAIYWSTSTVIPVGYGNISVSRWYILFFASLIIFVATICFVYVVVQMADDEFCLSRVGGALSRAFQRIASYCSCRSLPIDLRSSIESYFYTCQPNLYARSFHDVELLHDLPIGLRRDVALHVHKFLLQNDSGRSASNFDLGRVVEILLDQKPRSYLPGTVLFRPNPVVPVVVVVVVRGVVEVTSQFTGRSRLLSNATCFTIPQSNDVLIRTLTFTELYIIDFNQCIESLRYWGDVHIALADRLSSNLGTPDDEHAKFLLGLALYDPRFAKFDVRGVVHDDLAPVLAVAYRLNRDDLESVLLMVEALIRRKHIRDQLAVAVQDLFKKNRIPTNN